MKAWLRKSISTILTAMLGATALAAQTPPSDSPVARHGRLSVVNGALVDESGAQVQLRGMSSGGLQWAGRIVNDAAFAALAQDWKLDLIRLAMYVGEGGYASYPAIKERVTKGIELAIKHGIYVIVDWHVLTPGDPNDPVYKGADDFFKDIASRYGSYPNVIYEIMNEPNGQFVDWANELKPYAERIVGEIRGIDPDNLIVIGSGTWSQDVDLATEDPVEGSNLAYSFHFYAGTHGQGLRGKVQRAIDSGACVFCTEWGTTNADGRGGPFLAQTREWLAFLDERKISWANWSLSASNDESSAFKASAGLQPNREGPNGLRVWAASELSPSGTFVRDRLRSGGSGQSD
jgi:Endoglucanase